jgi:PAS domain S-box-containing protein
MSNNNAYDRRRWDILRRRAEEMLDRQPSDHKTLDNSEALDLIQELRVVQTELELQNEELRDSQVELDHSRRRFEKLFHAAPVGYVVLDRIGMIQQANEVFCQMVGRTVERVKNYSLRSFVVDGKQTDFDQRYPLLMRREPPRMIETRLRGREAYQTVDVRIEASPTRGLAGEDDQAMNLLVAVSDITLSRSLEKQLWESQKLEVTGQLAGGIAHDFNNILTVVQATVDLARLDLPDDSPVRTYLTQIEKSGNRAALLVQQLLAFAQADQGRPKVIDLNEEPLLLETMLNRLVPESIQLNWIRHKDLCRILIDPGQFDQILTNLVLNARDAVGESGNIRVHFRNFTLTPEEAGQMPDASPGDYLVVSVVDDGEGMTKEVQSRIFEPFYTTKPTGKGTGLGLSTVFGLVSQNGGFLDVQSQPGRGATFQVYFPRTDQELPVVSSKVPDFGDLDTQVRILLVEDEPMLLSLSQSLLIRRGFVVQAFQDPGEALSWFTENSAEVDLVISDVVMPGMNGPALVEQLLKIRPNLPCVFVSGYQQVEKQSQFMVDHGFAVIPKPFDSLTLLSAVRQALQ